MTGSSVVGSHFKTYLSLSEEKAFPLSPQWEAGGWGGSDSNRDAKHRAGHCATRQTKAKIIPSIRRSSDCLEG